jgi:predicted Zn-dependent protease
MVVGAAIGGGGGCNDPVSPDRSGIYSVADTSIVGVDTTIEVFRWTEHRLPVRFWADARGNMAALVGRAVGVWQDQFLYGEFRGILVTDSTRADVIVRWTDSVPPNVPPDPGPPLNACRGVTTFVFDTALVGPVHVSLEVFGMPATAAQVQACMRRLAIHELGHALGLGFARSRHSAFDEDIMFSPPVVDLPSRFDRRSVETLYHMTPTIGPPPP